jgi:hypothetical protein
MVSIFDADLIKGHFIVTDNGKRALVDTGCPYIINDGNKYSVPDGELFLDDARRNVDPTISEFRGLKYFAQHKVLFDYKKAAIIVADQGDDVAPVHPVAEFPISGLPARILFNLTIEGTIRRMIFDTGASIANYLSEPIVNTEKYICTVKDFHPLLGEYDVRLYEHSVEIGGETVGIPFGAQPEPIDQDVQRSGAIGVIGIGLYEKFQVLVDFPNSRLVLGKNE